MVRTEGQAADTLLQKATPGISYLNIETAWKNRPFKVLALKKAVQIQVREQTCLSILGNGIILRVNSERSSSVNQKACYRDTKGHLNPRNQTMSTVAESGMKPACICMDFWGKQIRNERF